MSDFSGFYYYQRPVSCSACIDNVESFGGEIDCKACENANRVKVKLLQISGRIFKHEAIVRHIDSGKIEAVPIRYLTYCGADDGL